MVVLRALQLALIILKFNLPFRDFDPFDSLGIALHSRHHLPDRRGCRIRVNRSTRDVSQEWMENHVVFPAVDNNLAFLACESFPQSSRTFNGRESTADNYNFCARHFYHSSATVVWKVK